MRRQAEKSVAGPTWVWIFFGVLVLLNVGAALYGRITLDEPTVPDMQAGPRMSMSFAGSDDFGSGVIVHRYPITGHDVGTLVVELKMIKPDLELPLSTATLTGLPADFDSSIRILEQDGKAFDREGEILFGLSIPLKSSQRTTWGAKYLIENTSSYTCNTQVQNGSPASGEQIEFFRKEFSDEDVVVTIVATLRWSN